MEAFLETLSQHDVSLASIDSALSRLRERAEWGSASAGQVGPGAASAQHLALLSKLCWVLDVGVPPMLYSTDGKHLTVTSLRAKAIDILGRIPNMDEVRSASGERIATLRSD